jgi:two-component system, sporulation sensor kinase B
MTLLTKDLLINLLIIISALFIIQLWFDHTKKIPSKRVITAVAGISIILCILFSQPLSNGSLFNLQKIPFIIGTLYAGWQSSIVLIIVMIICRPLVAVHGMVEMVVVYSVAAVLIAPLSKFFLTTSSKNRIIIATCISLGLPIIPGFFMFIIPLFEPPNFTIKEQIMYLILPTIGMAITTYIAEKIRQNMYLHEHIIKAEKLEAISHLAASISHEVRNPLTSAKGFMELLDQYDIPRDKQHEYLKIGIEELKQAERIIRDYLTFAKCSYDDTYEKIWINEEIKSVMDVLQPLANMNSVLPTLNLVPFHVFGDKTKIRQCFFNILKNSIEAMPNGGTILIEMKHQGENVLITVKDSGIGMTTDQIKRLGEPYFSTKGTKGTGLGMMVAFSIIRSLKGSIDTKSKLGKGTTFKIKLPIKS